MASQTERLTQIIFDISDGTLVAGVPARPVEKVDDTFDWKRLL